MTESDSVKSQIDQPEGHLLKVLGVTFGVAVTVGGMIGLGILRTPGVVAGQLGSVSLIVSVWVIGGIYALMGTASVAELSTSVPQAGGWYVYARRAFGDYFGFVVGWSDWLSTCAGLAFASITLGEYLPAVFPALQGHVTAVALAALVVLGVLNYVGLRSGSGIQNLTSFVKALGFVALIASCFIFGARYADASPPQALPHIATGPFALFLALILAMQSVIYAYDGWYAAAYFAEENEDATRDLPRSMMMGVVAVTAIYVLINVALLYVLPLGQMASSALPAGDAARSVFGDRGSLFISYLALLTLPSVINSSLLQGPRVLFAMSRDKLFWAKATTVNRGGTPSVGLLLTLIVTVILILSGTFEILLAVTAFLFVLNYASGFLAVFVLRRREPELYRPVKAWGYPWSTAIVLAGSVLFLIGQVLGDATNSFYAIVLLALSYPAFLMVSRSRAPVAVI